MIESTLQHTVHAPQQSPFYFVFLSSSQNMKAEKREILVRNSISIPKPAKKQKLDSACREDVQPKKKAMAFVTEVMVTDEPAWIIPSLILSLSGFLASV